MIGYWGEFEFTVSGNRIFTFDGFGRKASIEVEEQELEGSKPSTYVKGEALEEINFIIKLKPSLGVNVQYELDRLNAALYAKTPQYFVICNKPLTQNKWQLRSKDESEVVFDGAGNYLSATVSLTFKEYVRGGYKKD